MNVNFKSYLQVSVIPLFTLCLILSSCETNKETNQEHKRIAEQLFRNVYGSNYTKIDSLISDDMEASYPVFEQIFGSKVIRGREAYKNFAIGFNRRWTDAQVTIRESIAENESVVLVWSFSARRIKTEQDSSGVEKQQYRWGGFTLYHFNKSGKIISESGIEDSPLLTE